MIDSYYFTKDFTSSSTSCDAKSRSFHLFSVGDDQDHVQWQEGK